MELRKVIIYGFGGGIAVGIVFALLINGLALIPVIGVLALPAYLLGGLALLFAPVAAIPKLIERGEKMNPWDGRIGGAVYGGALAIANTVAAMVFNLIIGVLLVILGITAGDTSGMLLTSTSSVGAAGNLIWNIIVGVVIFIPAVILGFVAGWIAESRYGTTKAKTTK